ncbi:FecR family protein [Novosphingobium gossypii]|uniref:FecR family protein n=1 Tax=Novosphingobium gossypii TaxID=1604774 RepID=UPI003D25FFA2
MTEAGRGDISEDIYTQAGQWLNRLDAREPGVQAKIEQWLASDPRHRVAYDFTSRFLKDSSGLNETAVGIDGRLPLAPFYLRRRTHVMATTIAMVLLAGTTTAFLAGREGLSIFAPSARAATYETTIGEVRSVVLGNGTRLTLDTNTRLSIGPVGRALRIEIVRGRFRAETADKAQTFVVVAGQETVRVKGASFDAASISKGIRLIAVDAPLELGPEDEDPSTQVLAPGARAPHGAIDPAMPDIRSDENWVTGMLTLDATRLDEAITAINRYNTVQIRLTDQGLASRRISGAFRVADPQTFAANVARLLGVRTHISAGEIAISPADGNSAALLKK